MPHLDPQQLPPAAPSTRPRRSSLAKWAAGAALAVLGIGAGLSYLAPGESGDSVSSAEAAQLQYDFTAHGAVSVELVPVDQVQAAVTQMQLSPAESGALIARLSSSDRQSVRLARIKLWDSVAQDGDVVEVASAGYKRAVQLFHAPVEMLIPVDSTHGAEITGVRDGGGGITLGVQGSSTGVLLPVLAPGQTLSVPLTF